MARGDVTADADECEILHEMFIWKQILNKSIANLFLCLELVYRLALIGRADGASSKRSFRNKS
jgi:hypothetical protein